MIRIVPLGGLGEVGKNMMVYEHEGDSIVVDAGLSFPRDEQMGVDLVLPDFSYLADQRERIRAVLLTHGHEDHVGSLPYLLRQVGAPAVYGTKLTLELVASKLDEHGLLRATELREVAPEDGTFDLGPFRVELIRVAHSIPDSVAVMLEASSVRVLHTGDYKFDHTPVDGLKTDVGRLAEIGSMGVDLLLGDSTNAERPGVSISERLVGEAFQQIIPLRRGRVLVSSFASNIHRMQQAIDVAVQVGRKVCVVGRSMRKNMTLAGRFAAVSDRITTAEVVHVARLARLALIAGRDRAHDEQLADMLDHFADIDAPRPRRRRADDPAVPADQRAARATSSARPRPRRGARRRARAVDGRFRVPPIVGLDE